jgi:hypothetical protein
MLRALARTGRVDRVDFRFGPRPPVSRFSSQIYGIRFSGFLQADRAGDYEISTLSDEGVRVWVDGKVVIDNWIPHTVQRDAGVVRLPAGPVPIRIEYFQLAGDAILRLYWRDLAGPMNEIIPNKNLLISAPA